MNGWIVLRVLNNFFTFESEISILISEISLLQQYKEKLDVVVPAVEGVSEATTIKGHPAFTAVSLKSGLQFRVEEPKEEIIKWMQDQDTSGLTAG